MPVVSDQEREKARAVPIMDVWERLGLPEAKEGVAVNSPFREDKNPSLLVGGEKNIAFDFATRKSWDTIALVQEHKKCGFPDAVRWILDGNGTAPKNGRQHGRKKPEKPKFWKSMEKAAELYEASEPAAIVGEAVCFLQSEYGIDPRWIPFGWRVATNQDGDMGIVVKAQDPSGEACGYKWKSLRRDGKGKRGQSYFAGAGGALVMASDDPGAPVVIVAGEEKALAAKVAGFHVLCPLTGEERLGAEWIQRLLDHPREIVIAHDNDKTGREANEATFEALREAGFPEGMMRVIEWPKDTPEKGDLNDLLKTGGVDAVRGALADRGGLSVMNIDQVMAIKVPANDNMLGDRMLQRGEAALVSGQGGIGKSRLVQQLALDSILGRPWCGMHTHCPTARWLVFQTENSARRLQYDLQRMTKALGEYDRAKIVRQFLTLVPLTDEDRLLNFGEPESVKRMMRAVYKHRPDVVIFDPFIEFFSGDSENDARQMRDAFRWATKIARAGQIDAACVIVHHAKAGKTAIREAFGYDAANFGRGSKALYAAVRSAFNVVPGSQTDRNTLVVKPAKNNNGKLPDEVAVRLNEDTMLYEMSGDFDWSDYQESLRDRAGFGGRRGRPPSLTFEDLKEAMPKLDGAPKSEVIAFLQEKKDAAKSPAYRIVNAACKDGRIVKQGRKLYYPEELATEQSLAESPGEMKL